MCKVCGVIQGLWYHPSACPLIPHQHSSRGPSRRTRCTSQSAPPVNTIESFNKHDRKLLSHWNQVVITGDIVYHLDMECLLIQIVKCANKHTPQQPPPTNPPAGKDSLLMVHNLFIYLFVYSRVILRRSSFPTFCKIFRIFG